MAQDRFCALDSHATWLNPRLCRVVKISPFDRRCKQPRPRIYCDNTAQAGVSSIVLWCNRGGSSFLRRQPGARFGEISGEKIFDRNRAEAFGREGKGQVLPLFFADNRDLLDMFVILRLER